MNTFGYVGGNPVGFVDSFGLAEDGKLLNEENCDALKKLIAYEKQNGKIATLLKYHTFNFSRDAVNLDGAYPSLGGQVSIDWMMKSALGGLTANPITGEAAYILGKEFRNMIEGANPLLNISGEANSNAVPALSAWLYNKDMTLNILFSPALEECQCGSK